jgi:hypothetical protein
MAKKVQNRSLSRARDAKQDEFYTQLGDISNELKHYKAQLRGKTILCNCDDPFESNFFKYFALNFNALGLKKLIATSYLKSPIVGADLPLFAIEGLKPEGKEPYAIEINEVPDQNRDGAIDLADVEYLLKHNANTAQTVGHRHHQSAVLPIPRIRRSTCRVWQAVSDHREQERHHFCRTVSVAEGEQSPDRLPKYQLRYVV